MAKGWFRSALRRAYVVLVHVALAVALFNGDLPQRVLARLGVTIVEPEFGPHYASMRGYYSRIDAQVGPGAVPILGDSHVQSLWVAGVHPRAVNFGIGMDTALGVRQRLRDYSSLASAAAIVLAVGYNDLKRRGYDGWLEQMQGLLEELPPHVPVVCSGLFPIDERLRKELRGLNSRIRAANDTLARLCVERGLEFIDMYHRLADAHAQLDAAYDGGDGVHLNASGYAIWRDQLRLALGRVDAGRAAAEAAPRSQAEGTAIAPRPRD